MRYLIRVICLRHMREAPGRTLLTLFGIVLGVAVVFAIEVVNASVLQAFRHTVDDVAGKTTLEVGAGAGVSEDALERVRGVRGVVAAVPLIQESVRDVRAQRQVAVLAVDTLSDSKATGYDVSATGAVIDDTLAFANDPYGVLITRAYAQRAGLGIGARLELETAQGRKSFTVHGTLEPRGPAAMYGSDLLLMDVYAAQLAFDRGRRFDRIDVIAAAGADTADLARRIDRALEGKASVSRPQRRSQESERLLAGFRLALALASVVSLFVGGFIVYNALAIAVARRRVEIGVLRALGATRRHVLALFVGEGVLLGIAGTACGLAFGMLLARAVLGAVAATVSAVYVPVKVDAIAVSTHSVLLAASLGVAASLVAAFFPARRAASIEPVAAVHAAAEAADVTFASPAGSLKAGAAALLLAALVAWIAHVRQQALLAFTVAGLLSFAAAFLAPALAAAVGHVARRWASKLGPSARLGAVSFSRNAGRNAVATAALGMALANVVNVDALIDSLKSNTDAWLGRSFCADLFLFAGTEVHAKFEHPLPESLGESLRAMPEVEFVQKFRMVQQSFRGEPFYLMSEDFDGYRRYNELAVVDGELERARPELEAGTGIAASESFVRNFHVHRGDSVTLQTPDGPRRFRIALVYVDYRADVGILFTTRAAYTRIWRDRWVDLYSVYLAPGAAAERVRNRIAGQWGARYGLLTIGNREYRRELTGLIDRSMALARATELVAVIVAVLGIINTLLVSVLDRRREIGLIRAIGAVSAQVERMVLTESALIGCTAALSGVLLGTLLSAYMVMEALRLQVGWQMRFHVPGWVVLEAFVAAQIVAWAAAFWPMRLASRLQLVDALQYE